MGPGTCRALALELAVIAIGLVPGSAGVRGFRRGDDLAAFEGLVDSAERSVIGGRRPYRVPRGSSTGRSLAWQAWREGWTTGLLVVLFGLVVPLCPDLAAITARRVGRTVRLVAIASLVAGVSVFGMESASASRGSWSSTGSAGDGLVAGSPGLGPGDWRYSWA